jgi:ribonucleotide reductase beta subunit family protein with ferritin-like domain
MTSITILYSSFAFACRLGKKIVMGGGNSIHCVIHLMKYSDNDKKVHVTVECIIISKGEEEPQIIAKSGRRCFVHHVVTLILNT